MGRRVRSVMPSKSQLIRIKFSDELDPGEATPDRIRIRAGLRKYDAASPPAGTKSRCTDNSISCSVYRVTTPPELKGEGGDLASVRRVALGRNVSSERAMYCFPAAPARIPCGVRGPSCGSAFFQRQMLRR